MLATSSRLFSTWSCETGALLFALLNLILSAIGVLSGFSVLVYGYVNGIQVPFPYFVNLSAFTEHCLFSLMFAAFLFHGILRKRSEHIKPYLVLGAIFLSLSVVAFLLILIADFEVWSSGAALAIIFVGQVVYAPILAMIYNAYRKIKAANDANKHINKVTEVAPKGLKRFSSCSSETGTMVFASLNFISALFGVLGGFSGFVQCNWHVYCDETPLLLICAELSLLIMVFAACLFHGVLKKHPEHIKVYLVMGTVLLLLSNVGIMLLVPIGTITYYDPEYRIIPEISGLLALVVIMQVVYALILAMIYHTYRKMKAAPKDEREHKLFLIENMEEHLSTTEHKLLY